MPKRETEDKGLCRQEQCNKVAVIDRNFLLFSELDKLDENVEKAVDNLKQAMAVVARIKIRLQKHIEKHDQYKSFYRYKTLTKSRTEIYHWIFLSHHELTIYFHGKFFLYIFSNRNKFQSISFWQSDTPDNIRMRMRILRKAVDDENDFKECRQTIRRKLREARTKVNTRKQELKNAKYRRDKGRAGFMWKSSVYVFKHILHDETKSCTNNDTM